MMLQVQMDMNRHLVRVESSSFEKILNEYREEMERKQKVLEDREGVIRILSTVWERETTETLKFLVENSIQVEVLCTKLECNVWLISSELQICQTAFGNREKKVLLQPGRRTRVWNVSRKADIY